MPDSDFALKFASSFGDDSLVTNCRIGTSDGEVLYIPDFMIEDGEVIWLSKVEVAAELIRRSKEG